MVMIVCLKSNTYNDDNNIQIKQYTGVCDQVQAETYRQLTPAQHSALPASFSASDLPSNKDELWSSESSQMHTEMASHLSRMCYFDSQYKMIVLLGSENVHKK